MQSKVIDDFPERRYSGA